MAKPTREIKDEEQKQIKTEANGNKSPAKFQMPPSMPFMPPPQFNPMLRPQMMGLPPGMLPPLPHPLVAKIQSEPLGNPTATVYVQNLNEKIKIADIKNSLFQLFSNYGEVHEVHAKHNIKHKGQAYIVTADEETAETMIKTLRGYMFYGKPLRLNFSKKESDFIAKLRGTFDEAVIRKREIAHQEDDRVREIKKRRKIINKLLKLRNKTGAPPVQGQTVEPGELNQPAGYMYESLQPLTSAHHGYGEPEKYKILFLENLPKSVRAS